MQLEIRNLQFFNHRRFHSFLVIALCGSFLLASCQTASPKPGIRVSDEEIYVKRCGSCHEAYPREHFDVARWETFLKDHPKKKKDRAPRGDARIIAQYLGLP